MRVDALTGLTPEQQNEMVPNGTIFLGYRGSIAHGMFVPSTDPNSIDDKDLMGAYVAPKKFYIGYDRQDNVTKFINEWDSVCYEIRKLIDLFAKGNPNVLSLLWLDKKYYLHTTAEWHMILRARDIFLAKSVYQPFIGYAVAQLKGISRFSAEAQAKAERLENILTSFGIDPKELKLTQAQRDTPFVMQPDTMTLGEVADDYLELKQKYFGGYQGDKRKQLVRKLGYDAKNAAHLIRLLRMGCEFFEQGELIVERPDASELLSIKRGEWALDDVKAEAETLFARAKVAHEKSALPERPDKDKVEELCMNVISSYHGW